MHLFSPDGSKADNGPYMIGLVFQGVFCQLLPMPGLGNGKRLIEINDEIIFEVIGYSPAVTGSITDDLPLAWHDFYIGSPVECIDHNHGAIRLLKGKAELSSSFRRRNLRGHVCIRQVYAVIVRPGYFCLMGKPAGPGILAEFQMPLHRHDGKLAIVIDPGRWLMRLLKAPDLIKAILVGPSVTYFPCLGHPGIHTPRQPDSRIGIPVR